MALVHKSIAVESGIEFLDLQPLEINPLMSKCTIKVFYLGKNRNNNYITKEVATEMAKTLRGCPIVGYFKKDKDDFADHGEQIILDDEGIHFNILTRPYGFVAPDEKVWFQDYEDYDEFGNSVVRTYLCVNGYLWTGQYPEAQCIEEGGGKPHSMELNNMQGYWSEDIKDEVEFFIISDAIFSKLCILGDSVEPCYEGSSITVQQQDTNKFTLNKDYKQTLFTMMQQLQNALKGESQMENNEEKVTTPVGEGTEFTQEEQQVTAETTEQQDNSNQFSSEENDNNVETQDDSTSFKKAEDKDKDSEDEEDGGDADDDNDEEDDDKKKKASSKSTLEQNYETLEANFAQMKQEYEEMKANFQALVDFKNSVEDQKKDELIAKFFMLSDEDKKDVIENKTKYSYDEIKSKLCVIGFEKGVNFSAASDNGDEDEALNPNLGMVTFDLGNTEENSLPDWVRAVKEQESNI